MAKNNGIKHALAILIFGMLVCCVIAKLYENNLLDEESSPPTLPEVKRPPEDKDEDDESELRGCIENCKRDYIRHPEELTDCIELCFVPVRVLIVECAASPSFDVNLQQDNDDACDLGDNRSFEELAVAMTGTPQPPSPHICHAIPDPMVEEALRCNDSDDGGTIHVPREGPSSSRTQDYPPHFSTLNLEVGSAIGPVDRDSDILEQGGGFAGIEEL
ncbi:hypothetical protein PIB30_092138 [Stylosanthes scabra]|uniref:Uncharacterized protein n=1 Tax=Stylosanthes scabra TaxID=79078 RepID=A0ABU6YXL4_9FABA|nr:hypothetical protein [Stylosanthes scabra]